MTGKARSNPSPAIAAKVVMCVLLARSEIRSSPDASSLDAGDFQVRMACDSIQLTSEGGAVQVRFSNSQPSRPAAMSGGFRCGEVYPGIDFLIHGSEGATAAGAVEYDWHVAPDSDSGNIRLHFEHAEGLILGRDGALIAMYRSGEYRHSRPIAYQDVQGKRVAVDASWVLFSNHSAGFVLGRYDPAAPLIIDPVVEYSVALGGTKTGPNAWDFPVKFAVDRQGATYIAGVARTRDFPVTPNAFQKERKGTSDFFLAKINPAGDRMEYCTLIGGSGPEDLLRALEVDSSGAAYLAGLIASNDFPGLTDPGAGSFITKVSPDGSTIEYTYRVSGLVYSVLPSDNGSLFFGGGTGIYQGLRATPNAFQTANLGYNAFVGRLTPDGRRIEFLTFLGGTGSESVRAIAVDESRNIYVAGSSSSRDLPTTEGVFRRLRTGPDCDQQHGFVGCHDTFLAKFNPGASRLLYSTYLGGNQDDEPHSLAVNRFGEAVVLGATKSDDYPVTENALQRTRANLDSVLTRISPDASHVVYSTYLGGKGIQTPAGMVLDRTGNVYMAFETTVVDLLEVEPIQPGRGGLSQTSIPGDTRLCAVHPFVSPPTFSACKDGYVAVISPEGTLKFASYFGHEEHDFLVGIGLDPAGDILVGGGSHSFPPAFLLPGSPEGSAFAAKIAMTGTPVLTRENWYGDIRQLYHPPVIFRTVKQLQLALSKSDGIDQVNFLIPRELSVFVDPEPSLSVSPSTTIAVRRRGVRGIPMWKQLTLGRPVILRQPDGLAWAAHEDGSLITRDSPAKRDEVVRVYTSGLGPVDPPVPDEQPAPLSPPSHTVSSFLARVGAVAAEVLFSGLAAGLAGVYEVRIRIPLSAPPGVSNLEIDRSDFFFSLPAPIPIESLP